jgi:hypothetical protein
MEELATNEDKKKEFHFLLSKDRLFTKNMDKLCLDISTFKKS